ncbi:MAG TPA: amidohydrolase family protein [Methylomirabilota bacterium]|nr:amidohydrolase family protein [Methylomirabilota bacterium]
MMHNSNFTRTLRRKSLALVAAALALTTINAAFAADAILLRGTVVTMDDQFTVLKHGNVLIEGNKIAAVWEGNGKPKGLGNKTYTEINLGPDGMIFPGLINLHNHPYYNALPLWLAPSSHAQPNAGRNTGREPYGNRYQWTQPEEYRRLVVTPQRVLTDTRALNLGAELLKYSEVRALVGGETAIQGSPANPAADNILVRNVENGSFGRDRIDGRVPSIDNQGFINSLPNGLLRQMRNGSVEAWLVHLAEGVRDSDRLPGDTFSSRREFNLLRSIGLLNDATVIIHGTGLEPEDFSLMAPAPAARQDGAGDGRGAKLVWSPLSNLLLYGKTTAVYDALAAGVTVSLGTDWSPSGSHNLLAELKVADIALRDPRHLGGHRSRVAEVSLEGKEGSELKAAEEALDRLLVAMVTSNPAKTVRWDSEVGSIEAGKVADLLVITRPPHQPSRGLPATPYRHLIDATERDVRLVLVDGEPLAGDAYLMEALKPGDYEILTTPADWCPKAVDVTKAGVPKGTQTFAQIETLLREGLRAIGGDSPSPDGSPTGPENTWSYLKARFFGTAQMSNADFYNFVLVPSAGLTADGELNAEAVELAPVFTEQNDMHLQVLVGDVTTAGLLNDATPPYRLYPANLNHITPDGNALEDYVNKWFFLDVPPGHELCNHSHDDTH